jgi:exosortase A
MTPALALPRLGLSNWQRHLATLGLVAAAVLLLFRRDAAHMASIWWTSSTYNHCLLIPPIIVWLVRQRLPGLRRLEPAAWVPGLALGGLGAFAWLLGEAADAAVARHFGLVVMLEGAVVACLGKAVARALAFPLGYALFMVPFGGFLVPPLQTLTAEMAMALLGLAGVSAHIEGVFITTPTGWFEVAEACAGLQFLIAMAALGALAAHLCFRSWRRRAAFLAACLVVPVVANGLRAFGTILVAERFGVGFAAGFDHIVYGFVFFALVIAIIFAVAWRWFDRDPADDWFESAALRSARPAPVALVAGAALAIAALPLAWTSAEVGPGPLPAEFELPQVPGWTKAVAGADWRPRFAGAGLYRIARYADSRSEERRAGEEWDRLWSAEMRAVKNNYYSKPHWPRS